MAKGGRVGYKRKARNNVRLEKQGSDDSDEDYKVDEDEFNQSEDEYCSSLAEYESNESLGEFEEEEEEWVEKKVKKVTRPRGRKNFQQRKKKGVVKRRKKKVSHKEEDDEEEEAEEDYDDDDDDFADVNQRKKNGIMKPRRKKVSHNKEEDDGDDDEEEEEDYDDEEEEEEEDYDDDDDDDDFADVNHRKNNGILKPRRKNVSYKEEDEEKGDYDDDDDDVNHRKTNGIVKPRRKMISYKEEEEEEEDYDDDDDFAGVNHRKKIKVSHKEEEDDNVEILRKQEEDDLVDEKQGETGIKKNNASYQEGKEDGNSDDLADEDDEEFTPTEVLKATRRRKPVEKQVTRRNMRSSLSKEFRDENPTSRKRRTTRGRRRKTVVNSESDFVSSESDFEFTISEEEREQVIEASEFCRRLTTSLRSSTSSMMIKEEVFPPQRKCQARKGKEKVVNTKIELVKQVCGICLSEEGKRTVKGVLNCCSHYFCFACIMEWSKVESRCPLCKQRFTTINRTTRVNGGNDLGGAVFPVPERDQVYQPSEEELRGFLDPYESVLCTECQQGGDDAFMLLCDLCDSPAHTYCVGLGREVPDGNWYCDGCRPTLALSNGQTLNPTHDHGASHSLSFGSSPVSAVRETFDLNEVYVPDTPLAENSQSPRNHAGDFQGASQGSGFGALTLHDRRRIQRQIHQILNTRSRQSERSDDVGSLSGINFFGSPIIAPQPDVVPARMAPQSIYGNGRIQEYNTHSELNPRLSLREQALHNQASTSTNHSFGVLLNDEFGGINPRVGGDFSHQQLQPCSGISNTESETSTLPCQFREATVPSRTLQGSLHAPF